jgi:hypothetical protein
MKKYSNNFCDYKENIYFYALKIKGAGSSVGRAKD